MFDNRLRVNTALVLSDYKGFQLQTASPTDGVTPRTFNAPASGSYGAELEVSGVFGGFNFNAGVTYLHNEVKEAFNLADGTRPPAFVPPFVSNIRRVEAGTAIPFSPKWSANASIRYRIASDIGALTPQLEIAHASGQFTRLFHEGFSELPQHTTLNARLTCAPTAQISVQAFVENLTDETYATAITAASALPPVPSGVTYNPPRQWGVRLNFDF